MTEFHDWDDIRAELDDGDNDAINAEQARTRAWARAFHLAGAGHVIPAVQAAS